MDEELLEDIGSLPAEIPTGNDLIDATQNAIMGAAENVSEVLTAGKSVTENAEEIIPLYADVEFWVGMAFVLSICVLAKPLCKFIKQALQNRINKVISDIDDAAKLRDDAQNLLADYERRFINADKEAAQILQQARTGLQNLQKNELAKLKLDLQNKEKEAQRRIRSATQKAQYEINSSASLSAIRLAQQAIEQYLQNTDKSILIDQAIADLDKFAD